jgi:two-component system NtrC family response regulator
VKTKILLVDDEQRILNHMRQALEATYEVLTCVNEAEAFQIFEQQKPPVVILDLSLNQQDPSDLAGMRLLEQIIIREPSTRVIMVTGNSRDTNALRAIQLGASDYYVKPVRLDELKVMIQRALHIYNLQQRLREADSAHGQTFDGILGRSQSMQNVFRFIERVATSDLSVLITGESGTGKELVAYAIHRRSLRNNQPFVTVNCGAASEGILERELFGHEAGAFMGGDIQKPGKFELAHKGTLFLDEIGDLAPNLQLKLLCFLHDRRIDRVGATQPTDLDVRIIAATNHDLKKSLENQLFREDLYYRLKVAPVTVPPLRERKEDILPLARYFLHKSCREHRKRTMTLSSDANLALVSYRWPGNVRELGNVINRSVVLSSRTLLTAHDLGVAPDQVPGVNLKFAKRAIELDFVKQALSRNNGVVSRAARELGISRVSLYDLMQKHNIRIHEFKDPARNADHHLNLGEAV